MIKTIIVLLNFALKCRLVNVTRATALVQAGTQADQLASAIHHTGNNTQVAQEKVSFFSQDSKETTCSLIFVSVIKKEYQENNPFIKTINMYIFTKSIIGKTNCYLYARFSSICIKLINIKTKTILSTYYIRYS